MREVEENCVKSIKFVKKFDMTRNRKIYLTIGALIALLILVGYWLVPLRHYEGDETRIYAQAPGGYSSHHRKMDVPLVKPE